MIRPFCEGYYLTHRIDFLFPLSLSLFFGFLHLSVIWVSKIFLYHWILVILILSCFAWWPNFCLGLSDVTFFNTILDNISFGVSYISPYVSSFGMWGPLSDFIRFLRVSWCIQAMLDLQRPFHRHQWLLVSMRIMTILLILCKDLFHEDYDYPPVFIFAYKIKLLNQKLIKHERYLPGMWRGDLHLGTSFDWATHH